MQDTPGFSPSYPETPPPPPPPRPSRKGLWIGLAIGAVVLCLCCVVVVVGVSLYGKNIPIISSFFSTPTPPGLSYSNPDAGISLTYPASWVYSEEGDTSLGYAVMFASSQDILDNSTETIQTGAATVLMTDLAAADLGITADTADMTNTINAIADLFIGDAGSGRNLRNFTMSGYPAGSGLYTMTDPTSSANSSVYIAAALRNEELIIFLGVCPESEWSLHQANLEAIVNSTQLSVVP